MPLELSSSRLPTRYIPAPDYSLHAVPGKGVKRFWLHEKHIPWSFAAATMASASGCSEDCSAEPTSSSILSSGNPANKWQKIRHHRFTGRQGSGFVKYYGIDFFGLLQSRSVFDQHTKLRAPAGSHHDRGRGRQSHGTGTGYDQYGNKISEGCSKGCISQQNTRQTGDNG